MDTRLFLSLLLLGNVLGALGGVWLGHAIVGWLR